MKKALALAALAAASALLSVIWVTLAFLVALAPPPPAFIPHGQGGYAGARTVDCPPFANVVATGKATVSLAPLLGYTVDQFILQLGGGAFTKAMIANIRIIANEKVIWEDTGSRTDDRNEYRGLTANAAFLSIPFNEHFAATVSGQRAGSIDTVGAGITQLSMEVDIAGATTPTLAAQAVISRSPQVGNAAYQAVIAKVLQKTFNPGGAGEFVMDMAFSRKFASWIKRIHLFGATVTASRIKKNSIEIFKGTDAQNDFIQTEWRRVPQANVFTIDFIPDGDLDSALPLADANTLETYYTASGAGNITAVAELLDPLANN